ncbi:hypothetical protein [Dietzia aurantiaca]|uniref:Mce-associated membrane protein n=1 Tax=Dietzia aurantiaca TaxID=983873 RepID=A0ABV9PW75_9ACTN
MSESDDKTTESNVRAARRAQREAERAARAQRKADAARQRAMEAARAGGLFEGMEASSGAAGGAAAGAGAAAETATSPSASTPSASTPAVPATPGDSADPAGPTANVRDTPAREPMDPARQRALTRILAAVSVVLVVVAGLATWQYVEAREATAAEEQIANAPTAATDAAREIATQMFTYDHRTVDTDLAAVRPGLTEPALGEFVEQSMPTVASAAKQQEATVYATVAAAAPQDVVDQDNVTVLVMLNRMVSTKDAPEAASSASRLSLEMKREGDTWKLAKLNAL